MILNFYDLVGLRPNPDFNLKGSKYPVFNLKTLKWSSDISLFLIVYSATRKKKPLFINGLIL